MMTDEEKYIALQCIILGGENPRPMEFSPSDFLEEMYITYLKSKESK